MKLHKLDWHELRKLGWNKSFQQDFKMQLAVKRKLKEKERRDKKEKVKAKQKAKIEKYEQKIKSGDKIRSDKFQAVDIFSNSGSSTTVSTKPSQMQINDLENKLTKESLVAASPSQPPLANPSIPSPDLSRPPPPLYNYSSFGGGYGGFGGYSGFSGGGAGLQLSRRPKQGKIFVGRLPQHGVSDFHLLQHFTQFGRVVEVNRPVDRSKRRN